MNRRSFLGVLVKGAITVPVAALAVMAVEEPSPSSIEESLESLNAIFRLSTTQLNKFSKQLWDVARSTR